jgi:hypothetical protein
MNESRQQDTDGWSLSRRELLSTAGAVAATVLLPLPAASSPPLATRGARVTDWRAEDVWGLYPRYAEPIDFARPRDAAVFEVEPLDAL